MLAGERERASSLKADKLRGQGVLSRTIETNWNVSLSLPLSDSDPVTSERAGLFLARGRLAAGELLGPTFLLITAFSNCREGESEEGEKRGRRRDDKNWRERE